MFHVTHFAQTNSSRAALSFQGVLSYPDAFFLFFSGVLTFLVFFVILNLSLSPMGGWRFSTRPGSPPSPGIAVFFVHSTHWRLIMSIDSSLTGPGGGIPPKAEATFLPSTAGLGPAVDGGALPAPVNPEGESDGLVPTDGASPVLYTTSQMMKALGMASKSDTLKKIAGLGLEPVEKPAYGPGGHEALWDYAAYRACLVRAEEEEEAARIALIRKHVDALSIDERSTVMHNTIEELRGDFSREAAKAKMSNAVGFMQMLYEQLQHSQSSEEALEAKTKELEWQVEELKKRLDESESVCTVETYALNKGFAVSTSHAGSITRRLHKANAKDDGKVSSKKDPRLAATVWKMAILDYVWGEGWFHPSFDFKSPVTAFWDEASGSFVESFAQSVFSAVTSS